MGFLAAVAAKVVTWCLDLVLKFVAKVVEVEIRLMKKRKEARELKERQKNAKTDGNRDSAANDIGDKLQ